MRTRKVSAVKGEYFRVASLCSNPDILQKAYFTPITESEAEHLVKHFCPAADILFYQDIRSSAKDSGGNYYIRFCNNPLTEQDIKDNINYPRLTLGLVLHETAHLLAGLNNVHNIMFVKKLDELIELTKDENWKIIIESDIELKKEKKKAAKAISKILEQKCTTCNKVIEIISSFEDENFIYYETKCNHLFTKEKIKTDGLSLVDSFKSINNEHLYPFQKENVEKFKDANGRLCIFDEMGLGKGGLKTAILYTPTGIKTYGEIKIGDKIIGSDGKSYLVTGIFPRGLQQTYKITFSDSSNTIVDSEHLWAVNTPIRKFRNQPNLIKETQELIGDLELTAKNSTGKKNNKWYIPIVKPVEFEAQNIPIESYLLGVLLGDGYIGNKGSISIASEDPQIIIECFEGLNDLGILFSDLKLGSSNLNWKVNNSNLLRQRLEYLGLLGHTAESKFVPDCYKFNTIENRIAILQGLMDTDGWTSEDITQFTSVSEQLANDVIFLVQSLGGTCKLSSKIPTFTYKGEKKEGQRAYTVTINLEINPFRLLRKHQQYERKNRKYEPTRAIISIEDAGFQETICISTDAPDQLYVIEDFIVTHNTPSSIAIAHTYNLLPTIVVCKSGLRHQWKKMTEYWGGTIDDLCIPSINTQVINTSKDSCIIGMDFYIVSFDLLDLLPLNFFKKCRISNGQFLPLEIKFVIVDECQQIKNPEAQRTRALFNHFSKTKNIVFTSGSPIKNSGIEYYPTLHMVDPIKFPNRAKFASDWVDSYMKGPYIKYGGIRNYEKFKKETEKFIIRHTQAEVLPDLPDITRNFVYTDLSAKEASEYSEVAKEFSDYYYKTSKEDKEFFQNVLSYFTRMRHITGKAKISEAFDFAVDFLESTDRKLTIFTHHIDVREELVKKLNAYLTSKEMNTCLELVGNMDGVEKEKLKDKFNFDPNYRVLIASTLASGEGHNLQHACSDCLMLERQWNPSNEEQAEFRFKRPGQKSSVVNATYLIALETIDEYFTKLVEGKRNLIKYSLDGVKTGYNQNAILNELAVIIASRVPRKII